MKGFKQIDLWMQAGLILTCLLIGTYNHEYIFTGCITLIGWQLVSVAVHEAKLWFIKTKCRRYYHIAILFFLFATLLFTFKPLPFAIPLLAGTAFILIVCYFILSYREWHEIHKRPLSILK